MTTACPPCLTNLSLADIYRKSFPSASTSSFGSSYRQDSLDSHPAPLIDTYRKSYPSASTSSFASSIREDSTDTDSSVRSPKLTPRFERCLEGEPHYQFRKSNSMKLAIDNEGDLFNLALVLWLFLCSFVWTLLCQFDLFNLVSLMTSEDFFVIFPCKVPGMLLDSDYMTDA